MLPFSARKPSGGLFFDIKYSLAEERRKDSSRKLEPDYLIQVFDPRVKQLRSIGGCSLLCLFCGAVPAWWMSAVPGELGWVAGRLLFSWEGTTPTLALGQVHCPGCWEGQAVCPWPTVSTRGRGHTRVPTLVKVHPLLHLSFYGVTE